MAGAKNHDYHILPPSITPLLGSFSALTMFFGLVMWMHPEQFSYGSLVFGRYFELGVVRESTILNHGTEKASIITH
jgi:hypothetical protein